MGARRSADKSIALGVIGPAPDVPSPVYREPASWAPGKPRTAAELSLRTTDENLRAHSRRSVPGFRTIMSTKGAQGVSSGSSGERPPSSCDGPSRGYTVSTSPDVQLYRFGDFELDGDSLELRRSGEIVPLRPQAAKVLKLLLHNAGRLVSRDDIRDQVWGPDTHVDFDHSLHTAIRQVRAALGESGEEARLIQTYPRRGYRFEAAVEVERKSSGARGAAAEQPPAGIVQGAPVRPGGWRAPLAGALAVVAVLVGWVWLAAGPPGESHAERERVAVAPFRALTDSVEARAFTDGLDAELGGAFDRITDERTVVVGQPAALTSEQRRELARTQEVDLLLSGTVRSSDGMVRVTAQLLRVVDGVQLWAGSFEGALGRDLELQQSLAEQIASAVHEAIHASRP